MSQRKVFNKLMAFVLSLAMVFTSVNLPTLTMTTQAADETRSVSYDGTTLTAVLDSEDAVLNAEGKTVREVQFFYAVYDNMDAAQAADVGGFFGAADGAHVLTADGNGDYIYTVDKAITDGQVVRSNFNVLYNDAEGNDAGACPQTFEYYTYTVGTGDGEGDDPVDPPAEDFVTEDGYVDIEAKSNVTDGVWSWTDQGAAWTYDEASATVTSAAWGQQDWWSVQWSLQDFAVTAGDWIVEYDIVSTIDKPAYFKLVNFGAADNDTPIIETTMGSWNLTAGQKEHYKQTATIAADGKVRLFFNLGGGTGEGSVTISNVKLYQPGPEYINVLEKSQEENGVWSWDEQGAVWTYDETSATVTSPAWGQLDWWSVQWALQNFPVTEGKWLVEFDIESSIDKPAYFKLTTFGGANDDTPIIETTMGEWNLTAGQKEHYSQIATIEEDGNVRFFFNLGGGSGEGTVTISNFKLAEATQLPAPALSTTKMDKATGFKVGENVVLNFTDDADWRAANPVVTVEGKTVDADFAGGTLTINAAAFAKQGVYDIAVTADNYAKTTYTLPIYDASVATEDWEEEWSDEFNGDSLDLTKWDYEIGIQSGEDGKTDAPTYWGNNEKQYYIKEAISFEDGKMVITGNEITPEIREKYNITDNHVKYTSSRIRTVSEDGSEEMFKTTYGRIEAMIELPEADGYWPAFWMLPSNETIETYGTWAASGEIDIMEAVGQNPNYVNGTIHYGGQWPNNTNSGGTYFFPEGQSTGGAHEYAIEWEPGEMRWYVDDVLYHIENNWYATAPGASDNYAFPAPYDEDFYILFNLAMSGNYVSNVDPTDMGRQMKVDYVRVLKDKTEDYDRVVEEPAEIEPDSAFYDEHKTGALADGNYITDQAFATVHNANDGGAFGGTVIPTAGEWYLVVTDGGQATLTPTVVDGTTYAKVNVTAKTNYIQLLNHVPLAKGYTYKLSFDAYTDDASRSMAVAVKGDGDNGWGGYGAGLTANLTSTPQTFETVFTMAKDSDPTARLEFDMNTVGTAYVGNVKLVALTDEEIAELEQEKLNGPKSPLENGEHIYNGTFDQGTGKFVYWNKNGDYTVDTTGRTMKAVINASTSIDDATLWQPGIQLLANDKYKLTLDAKADAAKNIKVGLYSKTGTVYAEKVEEVNADGETITLEFTMPKKVSDTEAIFKAAFGGNTTSVEIDNVSMVRLTNMNVEWNANILYPLGNNSETWTKYGYFADPDHGGTVLENQAVPANGEVTVATQPADSDSNAWYYMVTVPVNLQVGTTYDLSFDVKTSVADQKLNVNVQEDVNYGSTFAETYDVSTGWTTISGKQFKSTLSGAAFIKFMMAAPTNAAGNFTFKNVKLTVVDAPYLVVDAKPAQLKVGTKYQVGVSHAITVNPDYEVYEYASSNTAAATISETGMITAVAAGMTTITITSGAGATTSFDLEVVTTDVEIDNADTTDLAKAVADAEAYLLETDKYTADSLADLAKAIEAAKAIIANIEDGVIYSQATVDAAVAKIATAVADLVLAVPEGTTDGTDDGSDDGSDDGTDKIKAGIHALAIPDQEYTGKAIKVKPVVYDGEDLLTLGKDYTLSYKNNKKVGTATVIVKGKGNYKGKYSFNFNIVQRDITKDGEQLYGVLKSGKTLVKVKPVVTTMIDGKSKKLGSKDYDVKLGYEVGAAGATGDKYTITVTGKGSYKGTIVYPVTFVANKNMLMKNAKITINPKKVDWTGEAQKPAVTVKAGKTTLTEGTDYTLVYADNVASGKATVIVTGIENKMFGVKTANFTIKGLNIKKEATVDPIAAVDYNGEAHCPAPVVKAKDGATLVAGVDYIVTKYAKNVKPGTAVITIQGIGKYEGKMTAKFKINKVTLTDANVVAAATAEYTKIGAKADVVVTVNGKVLVNGVDYKLSYKNNKKVGDATVTVAGKGGYAGKVVKSYKVEANDFDDIVVNAVAVVDGTALKKVKTTVTDNGKKLNKKEYTIKYNVVSADGTVKENAAATETVKAGDVVTVNVIANEGTNYKAGSLAADAFYVGKATVAKAKVKIASQSYTGDAITLDKDDFTTMKVGKDDLVLGEDFIITGYSNNVVKGSKATVTIEGIGDYCGTKTIKFKITERVVEDNWTGILPEGIQKFLEWLF